MFIWRGGGYRRIWELNLDPLMENTPRSRSRLPEVNEAKAKIYKNDKNVGSEKHFSKIHCLNPVS